MKKIQTKHSLQLLAQKNEMKYKFKGRTASLFLIKIFIVTLLSLSNSASAENVWKEILNKDGIKVFSREVPGSHILAFKGVAEVNADIMTVINAINDKSRHKEWIPRLSDSSTLKSISSFERVDYTHLTAPWPVSDRDIVYEIKIEIAENKNRAIIKMHSVKYPDMPPKKRIVRANLLESTYILTSLDKKKTLIESEFYGNLNGWIPPWFANFVQKSWPYETLKNLRKQLNNRYTSKDNSGHLASNFDSENEVQSFNQ